MERLNFTDYDDFVDYIIREYIYREKKDPYGTVSVIGHYDDIKVVLCRLIMDYGYDIHSVELSHPEINDYYDEYILTLCHDEIWCEPEKSKNGYMYIKNDVTFVLDDSNSALLSKVESGHVYETHLEMYDNDNDKDECDGNCEDCCCSLDTKETYKVNGKDVSKEEYEENIAKYDKRVRDHIEQVLTDYEDFLAEMNEWKELLGW